MQGDGELRHGDWNKDQQRYEDGCREDRPHPDQEWPSPEEWLREARRQAERWRELLDRLPDN